MSNEEFLRRLESALKERLPEDELKNVMDYHREYFTEAGENAADELDPPEIIAQRVLEEFHGGGKTPKKGGIPTWAKICILVVVAISVATAVKKGVWRVVNKVITTQEATNVVEEAVSGTAQMSEAEVTTVGDRTTVSGFLTAFSRVEVQGAVADVVLQPSDDYFFSVEYGPKERWDYELNGDTLTITGEGVTNPFSFAEGAIITVACPFDAQLGNVNVHLDVGNITVGSVKGETGFLETNVGDVNVTGSTFTELTCGADTGDIWVENGEFNALDCKNNVGDVAVDSVSIGSQVKLTTDVGNITATMPGSPRDCMMDLETSVGDIWVDDQLFSDEYETNEGVYILESSTDVGDITVTFVGESFSPPTPPSPPQPPTAP